MITLRHELAMALVVIAAGSTAIGALALVLTALTLRGDVVAPLAGALVCVLCAGVLLRAIRRIRRLAGGALRSARTIARAPRSSLSAQARSDLLAALETWSALETDSPRSPSILDSRDLAEAYVEQVDARLRMLGEIDVLPPSSPRLLIPIALALGIAGSSLASKDVRDASSLLYRRIDGRPPPPPAPLWNSLALTLQYPEHTGRPARRVENPSGSLRVPRATRLLIDIRARPSAGALTWVFSADAPSLSDAPPPRPLELDRTADGRFVGEFMVYDPGVWTVLAVLDGVQRSSPPAPIEIDVDEAPEIELLPLASADRAPTELDSVELRFRAHDDFGFAGAELVIAHGDEPPTRIRVGAPPAGRTWNHRFDWDLSAMPLPERSELEFWIEVRDNDPTPQPTTGHAGTGKVTASTRMRLGVRDQEKEHAENIDSLRALRDAAVDHLAERMTTTVFDRRSTESPRERLAEARVLHRNLGELLALLATSLDRVAVDAMSNGRDAETLTAIHGRLRRSFVVAEKLHERVPIGAAVGAPARAQSLLAMLAGNHERQVLELEDEIIRIDDLVDSQIVARIEGLVARVEASQRKLVDLLERLKAGDRSVAPMIEELQARLRQDLRRVQDARSQLDKEVDHQFLNLDAFQAMQARMDHQDLDEQLRRGDIDGAIARAKERLNELRGLREEVQDRLADAPEANVSPQERARLKLLRELSRLQDGERGVEGESRGAHQEWRERIAEETLEDDEAEALRASATTIERSLDEVNDARLGREGRRAIGDAVEELRRIATTNGALDAHEAATALRDAIERALGGAEAGEAEAKQLAKLRDAAAKLQRRSADSLPDDLDELLDDERLADLGVRQAGLGARARELLSLPEAEHLPEAGRKELKSAAEKLEQSLDALEERDTGAALRAQAEAIQRIQGAINSLRRTASSPSGGPGRTSTASERDRSLRDDVMDAMREEAPAGYTEPVKRYYEELLR